jgi:hypothetical protein
VVLNATSEICPRGDRGAQEYICVSRFRLVAWGQLLASAGVGACWMILIHVKAAFYLSATIRWLRVSCG